MSINMAPFLLCAASILHYLEVIKGRAIIANLSDQQPRKTDKENCVEGTIICPRYRANMRRGSRYELTLLKSKNES